MGKNLIKSKKNDFEKFSSPRPVGATFINKKLQFLAVCVLNLHKSKSLDHVIKGSCDFMERSSSLYVTNCQVWWSQLLW